MSEFIKDKGFGLAFISDTDPLKNIWIPLNREDMFIK